MELIIILLIFAGGIITGGILLSYQRKTGERVPSDRDQAEIISLFRTNSQVRNSHVQDKLGVSAATAERYLDRMEKRGLIRQKGRTGRSTYYVLNTSK